MTDGERIAKHSALWPFSKRKRCCPTLLLFRILFGFDSLIALVALYFFVVGLVDGSVSSFNMVLWLAILAGIATVLGGSMLLKVRGYRGPANALLSVLAFPGFCFALFLLLVLVLQPRWN